jgi:hypothetical protein
MVLIAISGMAIADGLNFFAGFASIFLAILAEQIGIKIFGGEKSPMKSVSDPEFSDPKSDAIIPSANDKVPKLEERVRTARARTSRSAGRSPLVRSGRRSRTVRTGPTTETTEPACANTPPR